MGIPPAISQSKTDRRCRSLARGARAWVAEVRYRGGAKRGAVLLTLTFAKHQEDKQVAYHLRRFWDGYAKRYGRVQRLSWLEYQANGRHHYHAIIIDPPLRAQGHDWRAIRDLWGQGRTNLQWRNAEWVDHTALRYAVGYAKKFGEKSYQQQYEQASRAIRTYQNNRLRSADARLERLPRWAHHAANEAGMRLVDGRRERHHRGLRVEGVPTGGVPTVVESYELTIDHGIHWHERRAWPPGAIVVTLGRAYWRRLDDLDSELDGAVHSAR